VNLPVLAVQLVRSRYRRKRKKGEKVEFRQLVSDAASDYLDAHPGSDWTYSQLVTGLTSEFGRRGGKKSGTVRRKKSAAKKRIEDDMNYQQELF
jgi:hypothetical protein